MTRVAFIGLGNMGSGMAANQAKAGREVVAFDLSADALGRAKEQGMKPAASAGERFHPTSSSGKFHGKINAATP